MRCFDKYHFDDHYSYNNNRQIHLSMVYFIYKLYEEVLYVFFHCFSSMQSLIPDGDCMER